MRTFRPSLTAIKIAVVVALPALIGFVLLFANDHTVGASASFPAPTHTGGPDENSCVVCHTTYKVNSGSGSVEIFGTPKNYVPGQTYQMSVRTAQIDATIFGFQMTAIDKDGRKAGTLIAPTTVPQKTQVNEGFVNVFVREYISHTIDGLFTEGVFGSNTWNFTWTAPSVSMGRVGFYASGNAANGDGRTGDDYIYTTSKASGSGTAISNFTDDLLSDIGVYRPSDGNWYTYDLAANTFKIQAWGLPSDIITPGDYDGDGITDVAVFRSSTGQWFLNMTTQGVAVLNFGQAGDVPVQGDYDGDGRTDIGIFRPSNGVWAIFGSTAGEIYRNWGVGTDKPVQADYDGDGKTDFALYRPSTGQWYLLLNSGQVQVFNWGIAEDKPAPGDYDGDGKIDLAVFRPSNGVWYLFQTSAGIRIASWGLSGDIAVPADYDGDGKTDIALFRPSTGVWYLLNSMIGFQAATWGLAGDRPIAAGYLPAQ